MSDKKNLNLDYDRVIKIEDGVYWVGCHDSQPGSMQSNPYLIVDGEEAVVIDGGSRYDFPTVMMKIMQTGIPPSSISALIYQNYNPRVCGSIPNLIDIIGRDDLKIISDQANLLYIRHYTGSSDLPSLRSIGYQFRFSSGRLLDFINTPYAHSAGSFVTFDRKTGFLFTGDLFSSYASDDWDLFLKLKPECSGCEGSDVCPSSGKFCPVSAIMDFHQRIMTSERALKYALDQIGRLPFTMIAPQLGSIIYNPEDIIQICERMSSIKGVGIDGVIGDRSFFELGDTRPIRERFKKHE